MKEQGTVSLGDVRQAESQWKLTQPALRMKQAERHEVEIRLKHLKRRLERLAGLKVEPLP
jgi:hypothetical protein